MSSMERQLRRDPERTLSAIARAMSPADAEIARRPEVMRFWRQRSRRRSDKAAAVPLDVVLIGRSRDSASTRSNLSCFSGGEDDVLVPPAMGRHLATQIPNCHATSFPAPATCHIDHMPEITKAFTRSAT
jgi:hypothetical protein